MTKGFRSAFLIVLALIAARCATAPPPAPALQGEDRYLVDPRIGFTAAAPEPLAGRFDAAWRTFQAADNATARTLFDRLRANAPGYLPADLAIAAVDIRDQRLADARAIVDALTQKQPDWTAARIYDAELSMREQNLRQAYDVYRKLSARAALPEVVGSRPMEARQRLLDSIMAGVQAYPEQAIPLLREALTIDPGARSTRMLLVHDLLAGKQWDEARQAIDPLLRNEADRSDVQQVLGEIEVGRGQYEQAIARYENLAKRDHDPAIAARLEQIKEEWNAANMPPQFSKALESDAVTRADLAVLLYWEVASVRFAQNLASPLIAVDIGDVVGREEVIRAIALGLYQVDPVTRRVNPGGLVMPPQLARYAAKVLSGRGAACARSVNNDPSKILAVCGVTDLSLTMPPDAPITGRQANEVVQEISRALGQ